MPPAAEEMVLYVPVVPASGRYCSYARCCYDRGAGRIGAEELIFQFQSNDVVSGYMGRVGFVRALRFGREDSSEVRVPLVCELAGDVRTSGLCANDGLCTNECE